MRVLAIDHGDVRAGTAICDPSGTIVRPLGVVSPPDPAEAARVAREQGAELKYWSPWITPRTTAKSRTGLIEGRVTQRSRWSEPAPSSSDDS